MILFVNHCFQCNLGLSGIELLIIISHWHLINIGRQKEVTDLCWLSGGNHHKSGQGFYQSFVLKSKFHN